MHFLAWIALTPLLCSLTDGDAGATPFQSGFFSLFTADLMIFGWLLPTFHTAHINLPTTIASWVALSAIVALYGGAFARFYVSVPWPSVRPWLAAAAWVALDEVRSTILTGFPWALASHTQARSPALIQIAAVTGAPGVTFLIILFNGALAEAINGAKRVRLQWSSIAAAALVVLTVAGGYWRLSRADANPPARSLNVSLLQGNIDQYRKWDEAYEADIRQTYAALSAKAAIDKPDLIVWPETAVPAWIPRDPTYVKWVGDVVRASNTPHLFGALSGTEEKGYNAAILALPDGSLADQYNKRHLVPFGEYVPLENLLKRVVPYLGQVGVFASGTESVHFHLGDLRLAPCICYESMFPSLVRNEARGADAIVNITNDGWFLKTSAPEQHFVVNIFRAVENGRPVFRAANTGISAFIDAFGRIIFESPLLVAAAYTQRVPIPDRSFHTIYSQWGNWFGWLCALAAAAWTGLALLQRLPGLSGNRSR